MKLLKKLLHIASISSVVAVVAPIVTSCNTNDVINGYNRLIPTVPQAVADAEHEKIGYTKEEAEKKYLDNISENPEIFFQDCKACCSNLMYECMHLQTTLFNPKIEIKLNFSNLSVNKEAKKLSYTIEGTVFAKNFNPGEGYMDANISFLFNINDLLYRLKGVSDGKWNFGIDNTQGSVVEITANGDIYLCGEMIGPTEWYVFHNETKQINFEKEDKKWRELMSLVFDMIEINYSYHMANIKYNRG